MNSKDYTDKLKEHYQTFFGVTGRAIVWEQGPIEKLHPAFYVLEIGPSKRHNMWVYLTIGMSLGRNDENLIELFAYSRERDPSKVELLTVNASFHRQVEPLNLHHTVLVGQLQNFDTTCDHGFISLPYIEGEDLEIFNHANKEIHCYWFIPITQKERDYKIQNGCEALEELFEKQQFDYLDINRRSVV